MEMDKQYARQAERDILPERTPEEAKALMARAKQGDRDAQYEMGLRCERREDAGLPAAPAIRWYWKAARQDHIAALKKLRSHYAPDAADSETDQRWKEERYREIELWLAAVEHPETELRQMKEILVKQGAFRSLEEIDESSPQVQCRIARAYAPWNKQKAVIWYRRAAEQGNRFAQKEMGEACLTGAGVEKDERQAVHWFMLAAEQGDAHAQYQLGRCYYKGIGTGRDRKKGIQWYQAAAEQGYVKAQARMSKLYEKGNGVSRDREQAEYWRRAAAETSFEASRSQWERYPDWVQTVFRKAEGGDAEAQYLLSRWYRRRGSVTGKNRKLEFYWCARAAEQGPPSAVRALEKLNTGKNPPKQKEQE